MGYMYMHTSDNVFKEEEEDRCEWDVCDNYGSQHQKREESLKIVYFYLNFNNRITKNPIPSILCIFDKVPGKNKFNG